MSAALTWPASWGVMRFSMKLVPNNRRHSSPYSRSTQVVGLLGDRWMVRFQMPVNTYLQAQLAEAMLATLRGSDGTMALWHLARPVPTGTMRGAPVLASTAAQGAQFLSITGASSGVNLISSPESFGSAVWSGAAAVTENTFVAPDGTMSADTLTDSSTSAFQGRSISFTVTSDAASYAASFYVRKTAGGSSATVALNFGLSGGTPVSVNARINTDTGANGGGVAVTSVDAEWWRCSVSIANNSTNNLLTFFLFPATSANGSFTDIVSSVGSAVFWGAQIERASSAGPYTGLASVKAGDMLGCGDQLLMVAADATANGSGAITVTITSPLRAAISSGTAVVWDKPSVLFRQESDDSAGSIEYLRGRAEPLQFVFLEGY